MLYLRISLLFLVCFLIVSCNDGKECIPGDTSCETPSVQIVSGVTREFTTLEVVTAPTDESTAPIESTQMSVPTIGVTSQPTVTSSPDFVPSPVSTEVPKLVQIEIHKQGTFRAQNLGSEVDYYNIRIEFAEGIADLIRRAVNNERISVPVRINFVYVGGRVENLTDETAPSLNIATGEDVSREVYLYWDNLTDIQSVSVVLDLPGSADNVIPQEWISISYR